MCGIVGYIGKKDTKEILLEGLNKLEYRGYDSCGIAIKEKNKINIFKTKGRIENLKKILDKKDIGKSNIGLGHTRWATHGKPTTKNAHPHHSENYEVVGVHNGIIENFQEIKNKLIENEYSFNSETDTEIAIKLIDYYFKKTNCPIKAIRKASSKFKGSYAICLMFKMFPDKLFVIKKDSPAVIGKCSNETFIASDTMAYLKYCQDFYFLENDELCEVEENKITFYNKENKIIKKKIQKIKNNFNDCDKEYFKHYMLKEIFEQPMVFEKNINHYIKEYNFQNFPINKSQLQKIKHIDIIACGSSYHVGIIGKYLIEELSKISVNVEVASEYRYRNPVINKNSLLIIISQSGETADSLAVLRMAKKLGQKVLAITNVEESSINKEADYKMPTFAGKEIAVATTKAFCCQLLNIFIFNLNLALNKKIISIQAKNEMIKKLINTKKALEEILKDKNNINKLSKNFLKTKKIFFIGRGFDYGLSMEGSLKLKEISYINSQAYAAGELKHGTISLIDKNTLVIGLLNDERLYEKTMSNMLETKARKAKLLSISFLRKNINESDFHYCNNKIQTNEIENIFTTMCFLQLFAYYVAENKGLDIDKPRNLAKSVTVE